MRGDRTGCLEALAVANHVLVMLEGRVVLEGAPESLSKADYRRLLWYAQRTAGGGAVTDADIYWAVSISSMDC